MRSGFLHCQQCAEDMLTEHDNKMFCLALDCFLIDAFKDFLVSGIVIYLITRPLGTIVDSYCSRPQQAKLGNTKEQNIFAKPRNETPREFGYVWTLFFAENDAFVPICLRRALFKGALMLK